MKYLKQMNSKEDNIYKEIEVIVENNPLTELFIQKHKDTLLKKYEQSNENYDLQRFLKLISTHQINEIEDFYTQGQIQ